MQGVGFGFRVSSSHLPGKAVDQKPRPPYTLFGFRVYGQGYGWFSNSPFLDPCARTKSRPLFPLFTVEGFWVSGYSDPELGLSPPKP